MIRLTEAELEVCHALPEVLRALADYHSSQETMAEPVGLSEAASFHRQRYDELRKEADRIESEW